jgi:arginyl-tRNA synthetase
MKEVHQLISKAVKQALDQDIEVELSVPEEQFGDYATNVALQLGKKLSANPREVAEKIVATLEKGSIIAEATIAGPGFINLKLTDQTLWQAAGASPIQSLSNQSILLEYSCPNAFKELHTGHLYQTIAGDTIGRLLEAGGASVFRANFGGDVGLHVARCLWGIQNMLAQGDPASLDQVPEDGRTQWISQAYVLGAKADSEDEVAANEIKTINKQIYAFHSENDHDSELAKIYWQCREWSYDYFKAFYEQLEVHAFDKYYPESTVMEPGLKLVKDNIGKVFEDSQGAVVFKGEDKGLHTRVFITSAGLPTYEAKDLGVIVTEIQDFEYDKRVLITGSDQTEYMKVVFASLGEIDSELAAKQNHLTNGTIRFGDGQKMSSRLGNVTRAAEVLETVAKVVQADTPQLRRDITLGAVKYSFLKQRIGGDIAFDVSESVSLQGNSGPYLQYAHARARSIMAKATSANAEVEELEAGERSLVRKLGDYARVVEQATSELMPHLICTYLYELSQEFNRFYENNRVIDDPREGQRLALVSQYADTLKSGLELLNIPTPEKM